jgi:GTPase
MFIDQIKVYAKAGHGGKGAVAFLRETFRPKGGPSGGNGGRGGDVILEADHDLNNLIAQYYVPRLIAQNGGQGMGKGMDGKAGHDLIIKVPCGTLVWKLPSPAPLAQDCGEEDAPASEGSEEPSKISSSLAFRPVIHRAANLKAVEIDLSAPENNPDKTDSPAANQEKELVADLTHHGERFILCKGGRGGLGNRNFATARRQSPRFAQPGEPGGEGDYLFELRIIAEVGLVGYPNAGKSTLLTAISKARPKIAAYPFTTLHPQIGIVEYADYLRLTVCDVPGLIEGAHRNVGLGHAFLRHIKRCLVLVILLDMAGTDNRNPWDDYKQILSELDLYDPGLLAKPRLVVANKMDEPNAAANLTKFKRRVRGIKVTQISAAFGEGIETFRNQIRAAVEPAKPT